MRRAGQLNEKIEIYKVNWVKNDYGSQVEELELRTSTRAKLMNLSGNRMVENDEIVHNYSKSFLVRFYVEVEDYDKILWNGKYYRVIDIQEDRQYQEKIINTELIND